MSSAQRLEAKITQRFIRITINICENKKASRNNGNNDNNGNNGNAIAVAEFEISAEIAVLCHFDNFLRVY